MISLFGGVVRFFVDRRLKAEVASVVNGLRHRR
jgi:hypothetical protein